MGRTHSRLWHCEIITVLCETHGCDAQSWNVGHRAGCRHHCPRFCVYFFRRGGQITNSKHERGEQRQQHKTACGTDSSRGNHAPCTDYRSDLLFLSNIKSQCNHSSRHMRSRRLQCKSRSDRSTCNPGTCRRRDSCRERAQHQRLRQRCAECPKTKQRVNMRIEDGVTRAT